MNIQHSTRNTQCSNKLVPVTYRTYIPPCEEDFQNPGFGGIKFEEELCSHNPYGEYRYEDATFQVADKNDGVVNINSVLWSKGDAFDDANNLFMSDAPYNGGYNHFEIRNYKRAYSLPSSNGNPGFSEGDVNPAMLRVENWIVDKFGRVEN